MIAEIVLLLNIRENWTVTTDCDEVDDNILLVSKIHATHPILNVETALFKDGKLNQSEGNELIIEKSSLETMDRLGVLEELLENFKDYCIFHK
jgi:hypothetical protein